MATKPIALILGAGPRVGAAIVSSLASLGYNIATASRSGTNTLSPTGILSLSADFTNPSCIPSLFARVVAQFRTYPSVVVWNAAALTPPPVPDSLFSVPVQAFEKDLNINTTSAYVAAQEAVKGWESMKEAEAGRKVFIYTGNILNQRILPVPMMLTLGVGKSASAHWVGLADALYKGKEGYRFFYADQRTPDGANIGTELDGPAHGDFFAELVKGESEVPWLATFVQGKGYVQF